jgi:hypothetical protein
MSPVTTINKSAEVSVKDTPSLELAPAEDTTRLSDASFSAYSKAIENSDTQAELVANKEAPGIITSLIAGCRDFVTGSIEAASTWCSKIAEGVGKVFLTLTDYASKAASKAAQNIATPETNRAVAETVETVTPAIGYGVGKTVGSTISGLAAGLGQLIKRD